MALLEKIISKTPHWIKTTYSAHIILSRLRERKMLRTYFNDEKGVGGEHTIIFCVDGRHKHGGLCDRLWGLISTYDCASSAGIPFRVKWITPFDLETFLEPAEYDWRIEPSQISASTKEVSIVCVSNCHNQKNQQRLLERMLHRDSLQVHVYTNAHAAQCRFSENFHKLFKPSAILAEAIERERKAIGGSYVSLSFRFQDALGDFRDDDSPDLDDKYRSRLLKDSLALIERVRKENPDVDKILVTSDSKTMVDVASALPYVYVIPGNIEHMGFTGTDSDINSHLKTFLDFFMIAGARKVYFARHPILYWSTFASTAALVGRRPYEEINIINSE